MKSMAIGRVSILLVATIGLCCIACKEKSDEKTPKIAPPEGSEWEGLAKAATPYREATIKVLGEDLPPLHSLDKLKGEFAETTGVAGIEIDFKNHSKVIQSILEGALSKEYKYDIIFVPHKELGKLVATKSVFPLTTFASHATLKDPEFDPDKQFFQPFWSEVATYDGGWYAVPLYMGGSVVVCRKDLLGSPEEKALFASQYPGQELSTPRTLKEWKRLAKFFHRPDSVAPMYGIGLLMSDESLWYNWQSILFVTGGNVLDSPHGWEYGDVVVNSPEAIAAVELYRWFSNYAPPDASSYSWGMGIAKQQAGASFMTLLQYDVLAEFEDPSKTKFAGQHDYFIPRTDSGGCASQLESWVGLIPVSAEHPEAAWLLLQWMMREDVQVKMHLEGNISPRKSTYDDSRVKALPYTTAVLESLECMTPKPMVPEADAIQDIITRKLQSVFSQNAEPAAAMNAAAEAIADRLRGKSSLRFPVN